MLEPRLSGEQISKSKVTETIFLLSPANLAGKRGKMVMSPKATFALARQVQSAKGAPLGEVFSFVSGLYFRGKVVYASTFGDDARVMTAGGGLMQLDEPVTELRLRDWLAVNVSEHNPHFTGPLAEPAT